MKKTILLIPFFLICSCNLWWTITDIPYYIKKSRWIKKASPVEKNYFDSIEIDVIDGHIFGDVKIAGKDRLFIFDTGANTTLDERDVDSEGMKTRPKPDYDVGDTSDGLYKHIRKTKMFRSEFINLVDTVVIGNTAFNEVGTTTLIWDIMNYNSECYNQRGIIGSNIMKSGVWSFDYVNKKIKFSNDINKFKLENAVSFDFDFAMRDILPVIKLPIGDTVFNAGIDTGNPSFALVTNEKLFNHALKKTRAAMGVSEIPNIHSYLQKKFTKKYLNFLMLEVNIFDTVKTPILAANQGLGMPGSNPFDLLLGYEFLKDFITTIDFQNKKIYFRAVNQQPQNIIDRKVRNISVSLLKYDNRPYVRSYIPSKIDTSKVDIGDTVTAINGTPIEEILFDDNYCEFIRDEKQFNTLPDTNIITIKNKKGETHSFKSYSITLFDD